MGEGEGLQEQRFDGKRAQSDDWQIPQTIKLKKLLFRAQCKWVNSVRCVRWKVVVVLMGNLRKWLPIQHSMLLYLFISWFSLSQTKFFTMIDY